ncbi:MAG TPA: DUF6351 family protein [Ktedonobacteraceae bacterium]|nr:DUF6351 family protein [Ktedonobacteraceae bacterium]
MKHRLLVLCTLLTLCSVFAFSFSDVAFARASSTYISSSCINTDGTTRALAGTINGSNYLIQVPGNWNGTLLLYSHGYRFTGSALTPQDTSDAVTGGALLHQGYALAGSSYSQNGWALQQAFQDQIAVLDAFNAACGKPMRTIAWGDSLGGIITAGLVQLHPERFSGAMPLCGVLSGGLGTWNQALDSSFAFNILLAGGMLPPVHITDPGAGFNTAQALIQAAQKTPQGRARIALSAALADLPGWFSSTSPEPASTDFAAQEQNQFLWQTQVDLAFAFFGRQELEIRAGGNPSWNIGVDYRLQLLRSVDRREVEALYKEAGLSLDKDLAALNKAPRIAPDLKASLYLSKFITFNGDLDIPVLTMHTTGDGLVVNTNEQTYAKVVHETGDTSLLRQVFVHRAGHCTMTPAERLTAIGTLVHRLDTGRWEDTTNPDRMNAEATALGPTFNIASPSFIHFQPATFLRPFAIPELFHR